MKKDEVKIGQSYSAKVSDRIVTVRIDSTDSHGGWNATNTTTGKRIRIKSAQRLRCSANVASASKAALAKRAAKAAADDACETVGCSKPTAVNYLGRRRCQECYEADTADAPSAEPQPAEKPARARKAPAEPTTKRVSAIDAAAQVLQASGKPMRAKEMIAEMAERGLWSSPGGKTPEATLYAAILREIGAKGAEARFRKVERGQFEFAAA